MAELPGRTRTARSIERIRRPPAGGEAMFMPECRVGRTKPRDVCRDFARTWTAPVHDAAGRDDDRGAGRAGCALEAMNQTSRAILQTVLATDTKNRPRNQNTTERERSGARRARTFCFQTS